MELYVYFQNMQSDGVEFPPREETSLTLFDPPQTHTIAETTFPYEDTDIEATLESDASGLRYMCNVLVFGILCA